MAYIGSSPASQGFIPGIDYFSGNGSTLAFTLSRNVTSVYQVEVAVDNVIQNPSSAYTVLNNTITFTSAPLTGTNNIWVEYVTFNSSLVQPGAGTVNTVQLGDINSISSATSLSLKTNVGVERMRIDASGNVGIGTSSPASRLDIGTGNLNFSGTAQRITGDFSNTTTTTPVAFQSSVTNGATQLVVIANGTSTNAGINFYSNSADITNSSRGLIRIDTLGPDFKIDSTRTGTGTYLPITFYTGGSERLRIDISGNVGIGTSSPGAKLDVNGITGWNGGSGVVSSFSGANVNILNGGLVRVNSTTSATTDAGGALSLGGYYSTTAASVDFASIAGRKENITAGDAAGYFQVSTRPAGGNLAERMRIDSSGNVGIGTSSPVRKLDVFSNLMRIGNGSPSYIEFGAYVTDLNNYVVGVETGSLAFYQGKYGGISTERMRIDSSGNLLVGTTSSISVGAVGILFNGAAKNGIDFKNSNASNTGTFQVFFNSAGAVAGSITQTGATSVGFNGTSDQRLKTNIIDAPSALSSVNAIKVRSFDWKSDGTHQEYGYIAQELLEVAPEAVSVPSDEKQMMGVDFGRLTPRLVKAIQELKAIIDTQQTTIVELQSDIKELKGVK